MKNPIIMLLLSGAMLSTSWMCYHSELFDRLNLPFVAKAAPSFNPNSFISICGAGGQKFPIPYTPTADSDPLAPKLEGLGNLEFKVSTENEEAQFFFNQGIRLVYAFNHAEALRAFQEAARLDPELAMAYWGQALSLGPNINDPFPDSTRQTEGFKAIQMAKDKSSNASDLEKALIEALTFRHTNKKEEQQPLNVAYFEAMEKTYAQFPDHPEVGTLYGAAIMNTMPWNYYDEHNQPREHTTECVSALQKVVEAYPNHPGAHHYFIHIIEAHDPDSAIPSADVLTTLMPSAGHIVHMPSHIYLAVGMYAEAAETNRHAIQADEDYIAQCQAQGVYPLAYYPHNLHFLWAAATMMGNSDEAIDVAEKVASKVPPELGNEVPFIQDFMSVPYQAYVRFGQWNDILTLPPPNEQLLHARMMWHYARGIAFVRKGQLDRAEIELVAVKNIVQRPETETLLAAYNNPTRNVGQIAETTLAAEILSAKGDEDAAIEMMKKGVEYELGLVYQEPAAWHSPVRHSLGALLIEAGKFDEAEEVYKADLEVHRNNGWALFGLHQSLIAQGKAEEAEKVKLQFEEAWAEADIALTSTKF